MPNDNAYYVHSGKVPVVAVLLMTVFGAVAALVLSVVYAYAIAYIPFIFLNFFLTIGFGALVGIAVGVGGKIGKARKPGLYALVGLLAGVAATYASWTAWFYANSGGELLLVNPAELWASVQIIAATGAWSLFDWTPTGFALYAIWAIEAVIIIGGSAVVAYAYVESTPFCEHCSQWVENIKSKVGLQAVDDEETFRKGLEQGRIELVRSLAAFTGDSSTSTEVEITRCPGCENSNFLTVSTAEISVDEKGKAKKKTNKFVRNLRITNRQWMEIAESW